MTETQTINNHPVFAALSREAREQIARNAEAVHNARLGNKVRNSGIDRCLCGSKYWERDRCVDCGGTAVEAE